MHTNYLKIALRNLLKHWNYSLINMLGLSVSIAACILILLYVQYEFGYDQQHANKDRIYRVTREWLNADGSANLHLGHVAPNVAPLLENDYPEIEHAARLIGLGRFSIIDGERNLQQAFFAADPSIFDVFTFPMVAGDCATVFDDPRSVVISETAAERIFGNETAIGRMIKVSIGNNQFLEANVVGVMKDIPEASHFHFDILILMSQYRAVAGEEALKDWGSNNFGTYLLFREGYDVERFVREEAPGFLQRHLGKNESSRIHLQKLTDIHLHSHLDSEFEVNGNIVYVYVLCGVAGLVLLIACINYMNLAIAGSFGRAKEVSIRKSLGARRLQIMAQFIGESVMLTFLSVILAFICVELVLPWFCNLAARNLSLNPFQGQILLSSLIGVLFIGVVAGSYPAFVLSNQDPVGALRGKGQSGSSHARMRQGLVVFQFAVTIILMIGVGGIRAQLHYCQTKDVGLTKDNVILIPSMPNMFENYESIKQRLMEDHRIVQVAASKRTPSLGLLDSSGARTLQGGEMRYLDFRIANVIVNEDFIPTYGIEMVAGRNFSRAFPTDSNQAFILNETAVEQIGWSSPANAIGQTFGYGDRTGTVVGVVKDFNYESFHNPITPIVMEIDLPSFNYLSVAINTVSNEDTEATLRHIELIWREYHPDTSFSYNFLDERYEALYRAEQRLGFLIGVFSILAIVIACLGLLGLAAFITQQRTKEIGIRKVMGASVRNILFMLSWNMVSWVVLANLIAWPIGWYVVNQWLQNFAYRTPVNLGLFAASGAMALAIAWITIIWQTLRAATTNPVESLRYE